MEEKELNEQNECYSCKHRYNIPGDCHIGCSKFCDGVKFSKHGIMSGWVVILPMFQICNFDPIWKLTMCKHFEDKNSH